MVIKQEEINKMTDQQFKEWSEKEMDKYIDPILDEKLKFQLVGLKAKIGRINKEKKTTVEKALELRALSLNERLYSVTKQAFLTIAIANNMSETEMRLARGIKLKPEPAVYTHNPDVVHMVDFTKTRDDNDKGE